MRAGQRISWETERKMKHLSKGATFQLLSVENLTVSVSWGNENEKAERGREWNGSLPAFLTSLSFFLFVRSLFKITKWLQTF